MTCDGTDDRIFFSDVLDIYKYNTIRTDTGGTNIASVITSNSIFVLMNNNNIIFFPNEISPKLIQLHVVLIAPQYNKTIILPNIYHIVLNSIHDTDDTLIHHIVIQ